MSGREAIAPSQPASDSITGLGRTTGGERIRAFDLARGLAIPFMIFVHILWHWGAPDTWGSPVGLLISFMAGPTAAPTFMFLMGASLAFSSRPTFARLAARGLWLVVLGYVLNFARGVIPFVLGTNAGVITAQQVAPFTPWWLATTVDIHHMAGLSLVAIAILRTRSNPGWLWVGLGGAIVLAAPWLRTLQFGTPLLDAPLTPILGSAPNVYYAVVPWLLFPLVGTVFGTILRRAPDRRRVFRQGGLLGLGLIVIAIPLLLVQQPSFDVITYWREPLSFAVAIVGIILAWLLLCELVTRRPWIDRRLGIVYAWSDRVLPMYFTHWILVGWGIGIVGFRDMELGPVLIAMVVTLYLTWKLSPLAAGLERTPRWLVRLLSWRAAPALEAPATAT
ncbi:MAG TPA: heparan-alpha-glucosaminide N-acetyltransferase domain-containing protein [Candidatus Limnocylindrales bacterium]|nr:heparan-alpha-glucosaminide N-acetyltransferase domain-containing protein [Candidatus Limnocylindrales bacterium]